MVSCQWPVVGITFEMSDERQRPKTEDCYPIDWPSVKRVLVVRLRSIGDTVLATPSLFALKRFLPEAKIDILLEDWVAPVLDEFDHVDEVLIAGRSTAEKLRTIREIRKRKYDVVFNLHGGSTSIFLTFASGARHRVGYSDHRYSSAYSHRLSSSADFWGRKKTHSAEQQMALLGFVGVPVEDRPRTRLAVTDAALERVSTKCGSGWLDSTNFALLHPSTAFVNKQWPTENYARVAEYLNQLGIETVAITSKDENAVLEKLTAESKVSILTFDDLTLPEITALASRAKLFVGNDSGIAHMAAAVGTPSVVIFGDSDVDHWRPWNPANDLPNEAVFSDVECTHAKGESRPGTESPKCIRCVLVEQVTAAIDRVLSARRP